MLLSPKLRQRIDIEQYTAVIDSNYGEEIKTWVAFAEDVAAEIMPMSGKEFVSAQENQNAVNTRITIRYIDGVTPTMRIVHGSDIYNIKAVLPDPTLKRHLTLMCEKGVNNG